MHYNIERTNKDRYVLGIYNQGTEIHRFAIQYNKRKMAIILNGKEVTPLEFIINELERYRCYVPYFGWLSVFDEQKTSDPIYTGLELFDKFSGLSLPKKTLDLKASLIKQVAKYEIERTEG